MPTDPKIVFLIGSDKQFESVLPETDELFEFMENSNGYCEFLTTDDVILRTRIGVFTQTEEEKQYLEKFGDVIFFDGAIYDSKLQWDVFPIILVDYHIKIRFGGVFFRGFTNS